MGTYQIHHKVRVDKCFPFGERKERPASWLIRAPSPIRKHLESFFECR